MIHSKRDNLPRKAWRGIKMSEARLIKRYPNRKLYDTGDSRYITLDEIAHLLADGIDIRIVDNQTKDDLTDVTLAQILVEQSRKGKLEHSVSNLKGMIKNTGEQCTKKISEPVTQLRSSVEESMTRLLKTGEERAAETRDQFHAWINQNTQAIDDIQKKWMSVFGIPLVVSTFSCDEGSDRRWKNGSALSLRLGRSVEFGLITPNGRL